jgi:hypothetical protein
VTPLDPAKAKSLESVPEKREWSQRLREAVLFRRKEPKDLFSCPRRNIVANTCDMPPPQTDKSLLVLFFRKELLPSSL